MTPKQERQLSVIHHPETMPMTMRIGLAMKLMPCPHIAAHALALNIVAADEASPGFLLDLLERIDLLQRVDRGEFDGDDAKQ